MKIALVNYDNGSRWPVLPQNLYHLQKVLSRHGFHKAHVIDFNLTKIPYSIFPWNKYDIVGLGFIAGYWPHKEAIKFSKALHGSGYKGIFILGGHGPSATPKYYLKKLKADAVFVGSADISLPNFIKGVDRGTPVAAGSIIPSLGYDVSADQKYSDWDMDVYRRIRFPNTRENEFAIQILTGRGCPYRCAFCYRMDAKYVSYPPHKIVETIEQYSLRWNITHFQFSDELLMASSKFVLNLCELLKNLQVKLGRRLYFDCNGRLNMAARRPDILKKMKKVGFRYINYGCESMSQKVLDNINKRQTVDEIYKGVKNTLDAGLSPGINFMWGNPGDDENSLFSAMQFIMARTDFSELRTIRPVTPYPGTALFKLLVKEGRCKNIDEFYENHVNSDLFSYHFMNEIDTMTANHLLWRANERLFRQYTFKNYEMRQNDMDHFYHCDPGVDPASFRGFREV